MNFEVNNRFDKSNPSLSLTNEDMGLNENRVSIVVADDHDRVRAGIRSLLSRVDDITVVGEARDGKEALNLVEELSPDVLLLDIEMPKLDGIQVAQRIQDKDLPVQILVLSAYDDTEYIASMLENGVAGYLTKDEVPKLLFSAIRGVARGEVGWVSQRVSEKIRIFNPGPDGRQITLTSREIEILRLLASKKTPYEIAELLDLNMTKINTHLKILTLKFHAKSRVDLIVLARQAQII